MTVRADARAERRRPVVLVLAGIAAVGVVGAIVLTPSAASRVGFAELYLTDLVIGASFTTIGVLVTQRRPDNAIGWLFLGIGVVEGLAAGLNHYAIVGLTSSPALPAARWAAWLAYWLVSLVVPSGLFLLLLLWFPSGRPISRAWGWVGRAGVAFSVLFAMAEILVIARMEITSSLFIENPTNVATSDVPENAWMVGLAILLIGVAGVVVRYRRSSGEERQQLRWFMFAVAFGIVPLALVVLVYLLLGAPEREPTWFVVAGSIVPLLAIGIGVPAACGVAILRYRLWELDVVVRKAVLATVMVVTVSAVYIAIVGGIGALVGSRLDSTLGFVAAAMLAVAFQPIRERAGRFADRVVYGRRATPYEVVSDFSERVADAYAADDVLPQIAQVLGEGTGAEAATVWLEVSGELRPAASWPQERSVARVPLDGEILPALGEPAFEVRHRGELLGALSVSMPANDPMNPTKERLARDLASQAGLVLRNVRLIEELRASRQRLVAAQDEERRKLERNLHDGAQQQLVALQVQLRLVEQLVPKDTDKALGLVRGVQDAARAALEDLRNLARGIYPPLLADQGLIAALTAQANRSPVPVTVVGDGVGRYPREVESAVYFCTLEALNNVAKYADATAVTVRLSEDDGLVRFRIDDDGRGFDPRLARQGTGVQGMMDRLDAVGGRLDISSEPGRGTSVEGVVPIERT
ncbi:MAG: histidine kinase [Actinomycetota bacterium]|nr:histidine kinase [Actinomycetota bacterium]